MGSRPSVGGRGGVCHRWAVYDRAAPSDCKGEDERQVTAGAAGSNGVVLWRWVVGCGCLFRQKSMHQAEVSGFGGL